ncbi:YSIRK-type signal peptide-containing protein [Desulfamplus magnetovallimortis]
MDIRHGCYSKTISRFSIRSLNVGTVSTCQVTDSLHSILR